ncbi:DnaA/Hda family protein [uncultured Alsobacter sp.]|uniref:DnaA ATPase domain-containing protein n=1 Tax=uncultured Alsobacter sp. TaxID=1748258 RepID=UPI0025DD8997|nr:DnaA/Hda family protein [uncultured Alsobacter sp.]
MPDPDGPPRQLALDLPFETRLDAEDFLVSPANEEAYGVVEAWPDWPDPVLLMVGPEGAGKSHLAAIWAARSHAWTVARAALRDADVPRLASTGALVLEDCDQAHGHEDALFHLLNLVRERRTFLLMTARHAPEAWGLATADILSRLRLAPRVQLGAPDDGLLKAVLVKLFLDRQLVIDTTVVDYIAQRIERSIPAARAVVDGLDRLALERGRRITRALAGEILRGAEDDGEDT